MPNLTDLMSAITVLRADLDRLESLRHMRVPDSGTPTELQLSIAAARGQVWALMTAIDNIWKLVD